MTGPALARATSVGVVGAVALTLGHVLRPYAVGAGGAAGWRSAVFVLAVAAAGAWRGRRVADANATWDGRALDGPMHAAARRRAAAAGAAGAVLAAALGYVAVHAW